MQNSNYNPYSITETTPKKKGPGWGTVFFTGFICFLVGAIVCAAVFMATGLVQTKTSASAAAAQSGSSSAQQYVPIPTPAATAAPVITPEPTPYMPPAEPVILPTPAPQTDVTQNAEQTAIQSNALADIYEKTLPSVVYVNNGIYVHSDVTERDNETYVSAGTGIIITSDGYVLTNSHIVDDAEVLKVTTSDGTEYKATLVGSDATIDIAVIKLEGASDLEVAAIGDSNSLRVGDSVMAIGNPGGEMIFTASTGILSGKNIEVNNDGNVMHLLQTDTALNPGNSGGPLLDDQGRVIGVCNMKSVYASIDEYGNVLYSEGISYAIPINDAIDVAQQLINYGYVPRPAIGIQGTEITEFMSEELELPRGVYISLILHDGPCDAAGIQAYDVIIGIDGKTITTFDELSTIIKSKEVGDKAVLTIWREGSIFDAEITLSDMNQINKVHDAYVASQGTTPVG